MILVVTLKKYILNITHIWENKSVTYEYLKLWTNFYILSFNLKTFKVEQKKRQWRVGKNVPQKSNNSNAMLAGMQNMQMDKITVKEQKTMTAGHYEVCNVRIKLLQIFKFFKNLIFFLLFMLFLCCFNATVRLEL